MSEAFTNSLNEVTKHIVTFNSIITHRIESVDKLMSDMTKYLENAKNVTVMLEATGAEIEGNGKANKTTVLGKQRGLFVTKKQTGASLLDYYREKIFLIKDIHNNLLTITTTLHDEHGLDVSLEHDYDKELEEVDDADKNKHDKKIKKIEKLVQKGHAHLAKEARINEKDEKIIHKDLHLFKKLYKDVFAQSGRLRGLCRSFARRNYNKIAKKSRLERKVMIRIIRTQSKFLSSFRKQTIVLVTFLNELVKELAIIGKSDAHITELVHNLEKDLKHVKALERLERKEKKFEKHLDKLPALRETHEDEDAAELSDDIEDEVESIKQIEDEEDDVINIIASLNEIDDFINKLVQQGTQEINSFDYYINYVTNSLMSGKKMLKKKPEQLKTFLEKIKGFSEKQITPLLQKVKEEDAQLHDAFVTGSKKVELLAADFDRLISGNDKSLHKSVNSMSDGISNINKDLFNRFKEVEKELNKIKKDEEKAKKDDKKLKKKTKKAHLQANKSDIKDMKRQERNLDEELQKNNDLKQKLEHDYILLQQEISKAKNSLPQFKVLQKNIIPKKKFKKIFSSLIHHIDKHGDVNKALEQSNEHYTNWLSNPYAVQEYVLFVTSLEEMTRDDIQVLKQLSSLYQSISANEGSLYNFFRQLEAAIQAFEEVDNGLGTLETDFKEYIEGSEELFERTKAEYQLFKEELEKLKKVEESIKTMHAATDIIVSSVNFYEGSMEKFSQSISYAVNNLRKEKNWGEQIPQGVSNLVNEAA